MSATTLKLPFKRFVAQVSTGSPRPKSSYLALMAENLDALQACPWREAADVPASLTGHDFTAATQFSDSYDAFKLTGNYDSAAMTDVAYAGMAAYRFTIPDSAISGILPITGVSLPIARDRFEAAGVHVSVALSSSAFPSDDWSVVRGSGAQAASAQLTQSVAYLTAGSPASGTVALDLSGVTAGNPATFLWVYLTLEDYTSHWSMYNSKEQRLYSIEGSAMLVGDSAEITFGGDVTPDASSGAAFVVCSGSALPEAGEGPAGIQVETQYTGDPLTAFEDVDGADGVKLLNDPAAYKTGVALAQSVAGLRMAYAALYAGAAAPVPPAAHAMRTGAKFLLEAATATRLTDDGEVAVGVWRITASALAVPFAAPSTFSPKSVRLDWEASAHPVTQGLVWRVWLKQGSAALSMPALADAAFWIPDSTSADGYDLVGTVGATESGGYAELPIALTAPLATILVTAFMPMDGINPSVGMATSFGCAAEFTPTITLK